MANNIIFSNCAKNINKWLEQVNKSSTDSKKEIAQELIKGDIFTNMQRDYKNSYEQLGWFGKRTTDAYLLAFLPGMYGLLSVTNNPENFYRYVSNSSNLTKLSKELSSTSLTSVLPDKDISIISDLIVIASFCIN